jgi:hypothetical protein
MNATRIEQAEPVTADGVPKHYPDAKRFGDGELYQTNQAGIISLPLRRPLISHRNDPLA